MKNAFIKSILIVITAFACSCQKRSSDNNEDKIQAVIKETKTNSDSEIAEIQKKFDELMKAASDAKKIADSASINIINFTGKVVRVDQLDSNGIVQKSYLDEFELDPISAVFKSKYETIMAFDLSGICFSLTDASCKNVIVMPQLMEKYGTEQSGRFTATPAVQAQIKTMASFPITKITKVERLEADSVYVSIKMDMGNVTGIPTEKNKITARISLISSLSKLKHNFSKLTEDKSNRQDSKTVETSLKPLSEAVVEVYIDAAEGGSMLNGGGSGHGTGFFISKDGLLLTNNHVIRGDTTCLNDLKCSIKLKQINQNDETNFYTVDARLLITNQEMDFAILKIEKPENMRILPLDLETNEVGSDLITLGYPGDKADKSQDSRDGVFLTYSFGKLVSMLDLGYVTSNYISGGASGSPLLNLTNKKLVAIISNGINPLPGEDGSSGLARPIQMINAKYDIVGYIDGKKQERVIDILKMLKVSKNSEDAKKALYAFELENTYLGLATLKNIMIEHEVSDIRLTIKKYLQDKDYLIGSDEE